ncbi:MAG: DUF6326 family protein [Actinomycetota bacterium]|jgi:hypothetical protein|nr:DUF6326 family protein [Actinomycetota bacterium]
MILSGLWMALTPTYLLGDAIRVYAGDFEAGEIADQPLSESLWLLVTSIMPIPIIMIVLSLTLPYPALRWACIIVSVVLIVFNLVAMPHKGKYNNFLIGTSLILNATIIWFAWQWI